MAHSDVRADLTAQGGPSSSPNVTDLLLAWGRGDRSALDALLPLIYGELRRQADRALRRESSGHTLQPTALVHEAYLRLIDQERVEWQNRSHFFGVAAQLIRRILIDHARSRHAVKRGGGAIQLTLEDGDGQRRSDADDAVDILSLNDALERLTALDPRQGQVVELRYFGGLSIQETAAAMGISVATVKREWAVARAWLRRELESA